MNSTTAIRRLALAEINFLEARSLASVLQNLNSTEHYITSGLMTGITVAYARGFIRNDGIGPLAGSFTQFPNDALRDAHGTIMTFRHKIYAHRDFTSSKDFRTEDPGGRLPYDVSIEFHDELTGFDLVVATPYLSDELVAALIQLCDLQAARIREELKKLIEPHLDPERLRPHRSYRIGVDFP